jgi:hypothetical protein
MPEPNVDLLNISPDEFDNLFYNILEELIKKNDTSPIIYNFTILGTIPNLDFDTSDLCKYNSRAKNMYEYFDKFYEDFYDYEWIISLMKYCEAYPQDYNQIYNKLKYSMILIIELIIEEFSAYTFKFS